MHYGVHRIACRERLAMAEVQERHRANCRVFDNFTVGVVLGSPVNLSVSLSASGSKP